MSDNEAAENPPKRQKTAFGAVAKNGALDEQSPEHYHKGNESPVDSNSDQDSANNLGAVEDESSASELDEDVLVAWFRKFRQDEKSDPKQMLRDQRILEDEDQLNFIDNEVAWQILHQSVQLLRKHLRTRPSPPPRLRLPDCHGLDDAVRLISQSKNIVVLTGAGISVSCGIPDFRSADGLYKMVEARFQLPDPQALFDIRYFVDNPEPFFQFAKELYPGNFQPSLSHKFIKTLETKDKLLRNYTQNIDTLEQVAGINNCLECHGSFRTATCYNCHHKVTCDDIRESIMAQDTPRCTKCDGEFNVVKPDIVFFGEGLPARFGPQLMEDREHVDLLIVMGSSLRVRPVCTIPARIPPHVPQILINRELVGQPHEFDINLLGNCDDVVHFLCQRLGWDMGQSDRETLTPEFLAPNFHLFPGARRPGMPSSWDENDATDDARNPPEQSPESDDPNQHNSSPGAD